MCLFTLVELKQYTQYSFSKCGPRHPEGQSTWLIISVMTPWHSWHLSVLTVTRTVYTQWQQSCGPSAGHQTTAPNLLTIILLLSATFS